MSGIDIFIVLVFGYNIVFGITQGLLKSLFGIGSFVLATILAPFFQNTVTELIKNNFTGNQEITKILGLGFSWFIIYIILNLGATVIIKGMEKTPLKILDRMAGVSLGLFMSLLIVVVPVLIIKAIPIVRDIPQVNHSLNKTVLLPLFYPVAKPFENFFKEKLEEQKEELMKKLKGKAIEKPNRNYDPTKSNKKKDIEETLKAYGLDSPKKK